MSRPINMRPYRKNSRAFFVWCPEDGEDESDAREVMAFDEEEAAEDRAEASDSDGDYTIVGGSDATYHVRAKVDPGEEQAPVMVFVVTGETVPHYSATEKTEAPHV